MNFSDLGLSDSILQAIKNENYERPYPIQIKAIPAFPSNDENKPIWY